MGEVIYSASPFQAFIWLFALILFCFLLGATGVLMGIFRRKEKVFTRLARAGAGVFLFLVGIVLAFVTYRSLTAGVETFPAHLGDKQVAHDNCGDAETCDRYILEMQAGSKFYDLEVTKDTYERAQVNSCYSVTYYPSKSLLGEPSYGDSYELVSNITRISTMACR